MARENETIEVILKGGNFVRRVTTEQNLGAQDAFIAQLIDNTPSPVAPIAHMKVKRGPLPEAIMPIGMSSSRSELTLCTELKELPFISTFERVMGTENYAPTYGGEPLPGTPLLRDPFPSEFLGGRVIFAMAFSKTNGDVPPWQPVKCYMGLKLSNDNEVRHFHYPNHFTDGRVCMGRDWDGAMWPTLPNSDQPNYKSGLLAIFRRALESFHETSVNSDLATRYTPTIFNKNPDGAWTFDNRQNNVEHHFPIMSVRVLNSLVPEAFNIFANATGNTD